MEILDNMPHDRLYRDYEGLDFPWTRQAVVDTNQEGKFYEKQTEITDKWCKLWVDINSRLPKMDSIAINKELKRQGMIERLIHSWKNLTGRRTSNKNIFIPTGALMLFTHLAKILPNHHLILADFDSFSTSSKTLNGINGPIVNIKLEKASQWQTYDDYLATPGDVDICFPTDFYFLKHAYRHITNKSPIVYKNEEMVHKYAIQGW